MVFYRTLSLFISLGLIALSIFFFLEDNDNNARFALFIAVYAYFSLFYIFKSMYYLRHRATFNEISFVIVLPVVPLIYAIVGNYSNINEIMLPNLLKIQLTLLDNQSWVSFVTLSGILSIPFVFFAIYLLQRSLLRYKHVRWSGYSTNGIPSRIVGGLLLIIIPAMYLLIGIILADFLFLLFGIVYLISNLITFFV